MQIDVYSQLSRLTIAFVCIGNPQANADEVAKVVNQSMRNAHGIQSYEFVVQEKEVQSDAKSGNAVSHLFRESRGRTRVDLFLKNLSEPGMVLAYNGEKFQNYDNRHSVLSVSRKNRFPSQYGVLNPMIAPYLWVVEYPNGQWSETKRKEQWSEVATRGRRVGEKTVNGFECIEIGIAPKVAKGTSYKVAFAKTRGYLPVEIVATRAEQLFSIKVNKIRTFDEEGVEFFVAVDILVNDEGAVRNYLIEPESMQLNRPIDETVFSLSPSMAKTFDDYDRNVARYEKTSSSISLRDPPRTNSVFLMILIFSCVCISLLFYFRFRKSGQR